MENGKPYKAKSQADPITLKFCDEKTGFAYGTEVIGATSEFRVVSAALGGLPPGEYKITMQVMALGSSDNQVDGKFADPSTTPLKFQTGSEKEQKITIDIGKATVSK